MDIRSNLRAVAAAKQIEARTGFDVLDDSQVEQAVALCAGQRARAVRQAVISGGLAAAIIVALVLVLVLGHAGTSALVLASVLLAVNVVRMAYALRAVRRLGRIPRSIEIARAEVRASARASSPSRGRARWS
jgi:Flp pilus assembly protein TadB